MEDLSSKPINPSLYITRHESKSSRASTIWHLPSELLIGILAYLDGKSLKAARQVCQRWGEAGAHSLYRRVYFAPRENVMTAFKKITNNPIFAASITEIIYDARLFWGYQDHSGQYLHLSGAFKFTDGVPDDCPEKGPEERRLRHIAGLEKQNSIFESDQDLDTLCCGMRRLFKLDQITIIDRFEDPLDNEAFDWSNHGWYETWSVKQFEGIPSPLQWESGDFILGVLPIDETWDFRGIYKLFNAMASNAPRITKLSIGVSADTYLASKQARKGLIAIAPQLSILKCWFESTLHDSPHEMRKVRDSLARISRRARQLEQLSLNLATVSLEFAQNLFRDQEWPVLRILEISGGELNFSILRAISNSHADSLREMRLRKIYLRGDEHWETVAVDLGKILSLDLVALSLLIDDPDIEFLNETDNIHYLDQRRTYQTARGFMQGVSSSHLEMFGDMDGSTVARQKHKNTHTSDFEDICERYQRIEVEDDIL